MNVHLKNNILLLTSLVLSVNFAACKDDELPKGGIEITEGTALVWERACDYHTLHIDTELPWTIKVEGTWITPLIMEGNGVTDLQVYVEENNNDGDRKGFIRITPQGYKATEISVTQKGKNTSDDNSTREMRNLIGFGYDLSTDYLSPQSIKAQVFNLEKINGDRFIHLTKRDTTEWSLISSNTTFRSISGMFWSKEANLYLYESPIEEFFSEKSRETVKQSKSYILMRKYDINNELKYSNPIKTIPEEAFTEDFIEAIKDAPNQRTGSSSYPYNKEYIYNLFDKYGTHVIVGEYYGGSIIYGMTVDKNVADNELMRAAALEIGWKSRLGLPLNKTERAFAPSINGNYHDKMTITGGDESLLANLSKEDGSCTEQELENWGKTISLEKSDLIRIKIYSIFELLPQNLLDWHLITTHGYSIPVSLSSSLLFNDYYNNKFKQK